MGARQYPESFEPQPARAASPDYETRRPAPSGAHRIIEQHYTLGVRYYREEKLREAIAEWRVVLENGPGQRQRPTQYRPGGEAAGAVSSSA